MKSKSPSVASRKSTSERAARLLQSLFGLAAIALLTTACSPSAPSVVAQDASAPTTEVELREASVAFDVPSAGWRLQTIAAYQKESENWFIHELLPPEGMAASVISEVSASVRFRGADLPAKHFVLGKTWAWDPDPEIQFIRSLDSLEEALADAMPLPLTSD